MLKDFVIVELNEFFDAVKVLSEINSLNLRDMVLVQNGESHIFSDDIYEDFELTGLSNKDFILLYVEDNRKGAKCMN